MAEWLPIVREDFECDHFRFVIKYDPNHNRGSVTHLLEYKERHREMNVADFRGMVKTMLRLDERMGVHVSAES